QAGGTDAVRGNDDDVGLLAPFDAVAVDVNGAVGEALRVHGDLTDAGTGDEVDAVVDGMFPVRDVGRCLGALRAAGLTGAAADTRLAATIGTGGDGIGGRPPVPSELVHALGRLDPGLAQGKRRKGVCLAVRV